jgi:hypothetical protein
MATVKNVFVSGTLENIVFYTRMGKQCARIKRPSIRQTTATKKRGINFGIAARVGKGLRRGLVAAMPNPTDRSMQSRFSGAIAKWLGPSELNILEPCDHLPFLSNLPFTEDDTFCERFKVPVSVKVNSGSVSVSMGSFVPVRNISAPAGTLSVKLIIAVAAARLTTGIPSGWHTEYIEIPFNKVAIPARTLDFPVAADEGNIMVTAARLLYLGSKNNHLWIIEKKGFNPAGVINAAYC